jgi:hypothetical protein
MNDDARINADAMYKKLLEVGEAWADAKSAYQALDDATASVLADLTQSYRDADTSRVEAETMARRCSTYRDHLASVAVANKAYLRAQVRYDSLKTLVELRRSEESTRRAEMAL